MNVTKKPYELPDDYVEEKALILLLEMQKETERFVKAMQEETDCVLSDNLWGWAESGLRDRFRNIRELMDGFEELQYRLGRETENELMVRLELAAK
jgi:hypothetical protein